MSTQTQIEILMCAPICTKVLMSTQTQIEILCAHNSTEVPMSTQTQIEILCAHTIISSRGPNVYIHK